MSLIKVQKKGHPETEKSGRFFRSTMIDMDSRLRAARGFGKTETEAAAGVFRQLKDRGHPDAPPPAVSDGWGGIREAMVEVYGKVPEQAGLLRGNNRSRDGNIRRLLNREMRRGVFPAPDLRRYTEAWRNLSDFSGKVRLMSNGLI